MIIAGVDPGLMTGVALITWDGENWPEPPVQESYQVEYPDLPKFMDDLVYRADVIAIERFTISGRTIKASRQYEALYAIGGILFLADLKHRFVKLQNAADAKKAYSNVTLGQFGWNVKGRHAKDALRHALLATHSRTLYADVREFYSPPTPDEDA